jgi:membrane-bound serine protease (ClpP class)
MSPIIALILAALVLVFFEVILPGGILGVLAALCILLATWLAGSQFGASGAVLTFLSAAVAVALLVYIEFKLLARTSLGGGFFLKNSVTGHSNQAPATNEVVGKEGVALTRLNPSGRVAIDGQSYEAYSQDGYIDADQPIRVAGQDNFKLIIKKP